MALIPKLKYPAQVEVTDLGYPQGKARNVGTGGDGSGTPFEAALVNDQWGFQQALLAAAAITPSGNPDKVGASQYLDAIKSLISKFADTAHTWFAKQTFNFGISVNNLSLAEYNEGVFFDVPQLRTVLVPLIPYQSGGWIAASNGQWAAPSSGNSIYFLVGKGVIPGGAQIERVRASVNSQISVTLSARQVYFDTNVPSAPVLNPEITDTLNPSGMQATILTANVAGQWGGHINGQYEIMIELNPVAGTGCGLRWIAIDFYDVAINNT